MIFIASTGSNPEANSYLTLEEAGQLIGTAFDAVGEDEQKIALIKASFAIDSIQMYSGAKLADGQLLKFPRKGQTVIPTAIKLATATLIEKYIDGSEFREVSKESMSKLSWEFVTSKGAVGNDVLAYLKPLKASTVRLNYGNK